MSDKFVEVYSKVIHEYDNGMEQIRLCVSQFKDKEYLNIRKYYLDFNEEWKPTPTGISFPLTIEGTRELFVSASEIISLAESKDIIKEHFIEIINTIYQK